MMDYLQHVPKTELARNTRQVIREAQRGYTVLVENHGQAEVAIMDILDYRILRAFMAYHTQSSEGTPDGLSTNVSADGNDPQQLVNRVMRVYLRGDISLAKAAEWIEVPTLDLQFRFHRLDLPLNLGAEDVQTAQDEVDTALSAGG